VKPLGQQNLYEILDVPFDATTAAIAEAVERAQALYAPGSLATYTLMDPDEEQLLSRLIEAARVTLLDPVARARYDERITGPSQAASEATPPPSSTPQIVDAALRMAWPELPPVIPAARQADEEWEEDLPVPPVIPAAAVAQPEPRAVEAVPEPSPPPPSEPPAAARPPPILLSREVAPAAPVMTPAPVAAPPAQPPAAPSIGEATVWSGEVLRKLREARGFSLQQISDRTKVTRHHIENIESDRFEQLPASVYLRGILLSIARELRLDGQKVARSYLERVAAACSATSPIPRQR
jgi:curved DNA-binding protein CbpA